MKAQFRLLKFSFVLLILLLTVVIGQGQASTETSTPAGMLRNPLNVDNGADPWLTSYEGNYYLAATTWASTLTMRKSPTLAGLKTAPVVQSYFETDPSRCCRMIARTATRPTQPGGSDRGWRMLPRFRWSRTTSREVTSANCSASRR